MTRMKDSGIEWIGEVPEEWGIVRLKDCLEINNGKDYKDIETDETGYPVIGSGGQFAYARKYLHDGTAILLGRKGTIDKPLYIEGKFWTVDTMFYSVPKSGIYAKFIYYVALQIPFGLYSTNTALPSMTQTDLQNHHFVMPLLDEQTQIADFLDKKVAQLDKVKSLLEEQIKTLEDYRQSLIYETITKGLDKTVPLKDSGVDWIGQIPIASSLKKLKDLLATPLQYGANESGEDYDESLPRYIRITDIDSNGDLKREGKQSLAEKIATPYILQDGDLLFARSGATVGKTFLYKSCFGRSAFAGYLIKASLDKSLVLPEYLYYYTLNPLFNTWKEMTFIQSTIQNIGADRYNILPVLIYPIEEQQKMIDYLDCKISQINQMIAIKKEQTENINKQRQTLIYDVVTGKRRI